MRRIYTNLIKRLNKPLLYNDCTKGTKKTYTCITSLEAHVGTSPCRPNPKMYILEANYAELHSMERFKNVSSVGPKRNIEMKQVPHHLKLLLSILKNPRIPLYPHNPQQSETNNLPKSLASSRVPKTHERNNHHIVNIAWLNPHHPSLWEYHVP